MKKNISSVYYRRKRKGLTNYKKRLKLLLSRKPRLVVRKSLNHIILQVVDYDPKGDKILTAAHSLHLKKKGWPYNCGNVPAAYLTGLLLGKSAKEKHIKEVILDTGMFTPTKGSRTYAALKGVLDAGISVSHSEEVIPQEDRLLGKHIETFAHAVKNNNEKFKKQFSLLTSKAAPSEISKHVASFKSKIQGGA